jgi:arylsulfatase/arylsulfatase A
MSGLFGSQTFFRFSLVLEGSIMMRRSARFGGLWVAAVAVHVVAVAAEGQAHAADARPNVVLIMTDDQGYGDLGVHGNPIVRTPNLDRMAGQSAVLSQFYVSPVCTPTRACLMTGRYNYRTRAIDTFRGRAMMEPEEVTIAEMLRQAGYATGIFGKWHLGDCYPMRPIDQGFEMALVHRGGGIGQPSDPPGAEGKYTDPVLFRNGEPVALKGYCTDIYFTEGMRWAEKVAGEGRPFFMYLPTNCPHGPFDDVPPKEYAYYRQQAITADRFPDRGGQPIPRNMQADTQARVYAMIENIDQNVGRLLRWLEEQKLHERTLVIFMTDNGRATPGYNAGLRGNKGTVYEGGLRSPFFAYWPGKLAGGVASDAIAAHIDLAPTILEVCGVTPPPQVRFDGRSLWPLLTRAAANWPARTLFFQSHRGDVPVRYHNCAIRTPQWKLVSATGFGPESLPEGGPRWELFDMTRDPYEQHNLTAEHPDVVSQLKAAYDAWFDDVSHTRPDNYAPPRIVAGSPHERVTVLTRQDWRGAGWGPQDEGHWLLTITGGLRFDVKVLVAKASQPRTVHVQVGTLHLTAPLAAGTTEHTFAGQQLPEGPQSLYAWVEEAGRRSGVRFVELHQTAR